MSISAAPNSGICCRFRTLISPLELQQALAEIRTLRGLIPICAQCQKIRNDQGAWERFEAYVSAHTEAEFTHGYCPECSHKLFGELLASSRPRKDSPERRAVNAD